jgi:hypothetical protein
MKKTITIFLTIILSFLFFYGCAVKEPKVLQSGFYYKDSDKEELSSYFAYESSIKAFETGEVSLNVYVGLFSDSLSETDCEIPEGFSLEIIVINKDDYSGSLNSETVQTVLNVITDFSNAYSYDYFIIDAKSGGYLVHYNYCDRITIPSELFKDESGVLMLGYYSKRIIEAEEYEYGEVIAQELYYKVEDNKIFLASEKGDL